MVLEANTPPEFPLKMDRDDLDLPAEQVDRYNQEVQRLKLDHLPGSEDEQHRKTC